MLNSEFASRIINDMNALNKDSHISRRYIVSIGKQISESYIAQRWDDGSLINDQDLFSFINCLEMERIRSIDCPFIELRRCDMLMRSKKKLPKMVWGSLFPSIVFVSTIDQNIFFDYSIPRNISNDKNRVFSDIKQYKYYVLDNYLYIPNINIEAVNIGAIFMDEYEADELNGCENCKVNCKSYWDYKFICPDKLREYVIDKTIAEITGTKMQIPIDENPDLDSNQKSKKAP